MLWLGLEQHQGEWDELKKTGGDLSVYAETVSLREFHGETESYRSVFNCLIYERRSVILSMI